MKVLLMVTIASLGLAGCGNGDSDPPATTDNGVSAADTTVDTPEPPKDNGVAEDPGSEPGEVAVIPTKKDTAGAPDTSGPTIVVTLPATTCFQAFVCAGTCDKGDTACTDKCEEGASEDIKTKLEAILTCQKDNCASGTLDTCATDKAQCWSSLQPCAFGSAAAGTAKCEAAATCLRDCKDNEWGCVETCFNSVIEAQQRDLVTYLLCLKNHCGLEPSDECINEANGLECGPAAAFCSG